MKQTVLYTKLLAFVAILIETDTHFFHNDAYTLVYHQEHKDHQSASDICKSHGGYLPVIKNHIIPEILIDVPSLRKVSVWIGLNYVNGSWLWDDGSRSSTSPLDGKQTPSENECISVLLQPDAKPQPHKCDTKLPFFCQYNKGSCYFRIYPHSSIVGHNKFSLTSTSLYTCKNVCGHATEFECASFEYSPINRFCQLNDVNRWTAEDNYVYFDQSWDYYHKTCYISTILPEDSDQTSYSPVFSDITSTSTTSTIHTTEDVIGSRLILSAVHIEKHYKRNNCNIPTRIINIMTQFNQLNRHTKNTTGSIPESCGLLILKGSTSPRDQYFRTEPNLELIQPRQYILQDLALSWNDAVEYCENVGAQLAIIDGPSNIPESGYQNSVNPEELYWIGLRRMDTKGWRWIDSSALKWSNFKYEPNDLDFIQVCGTLSLPSGWWFTNVCAEKRRFICQYNADSCHFIVTNNAAMIALNSEIYNNISQYECQNNCVAAVLCRSYEYNNKTKVCQLSTENRWTAFQYFQTGYTDWKYVHRRCSFGVNRDTDSTTTMSSIDYSSTITDDITTRARTTLNPTAVADKFFREMIQELKQIGKEIKEKRLEQARTSAVDNRPSAKGVGITAVIILVGLLGSIAILDISTISLQCKQFSKQEQQKSSRYKYRTKTIHTNNNNNNAEGNNRENHGCLQQPKMDTTSVENFEISVVDNTCNVISANSLTLGLYDNDSGSSKITYQDNKNKQIENMESTDQDTAISKFKRRTSIAKEMSDEQRTMHKDTKEYIMLSHTEQSVKSLTANSEIIVQNNCIHQNTNDCKTHL